ncbi:MAG: hypothetical protein C0412_14135 [Flavobacterium sp.]|nr:hypothetical protein [Flavobacterium sp.]
MGSSPSAGSLIKPSNESQVVFRFTTFCEENFWINPKTIFFLLTAISGKQVFYLYSKRIANYKYQTNQIKKTSTFFSKKNNNLNI